LVFFILLFLVSLVQATVVVNFDKVKQSFIEDAYGVLYGEYPFDLTFRINLKNEAIPFFENYFNVSIRSEIKYTLPENFLSITAEDIENALLGYGHELVPFFLANCFSEVFGYRYGVLAFVFDEKDFERIFIANNKLLAEKDSIDGILYLKKSIVPIESMEGVYNISISSKNMTKTIQVYLIPAEKERLEYWYRAVNIYGPPGILITSTRVLGPLNSDNSIIRDLCYYVGISLEGAKGLGFDSYSKYIESVNKKIYDSIGVTPNTPKKDVESLFVRSYLSKYMKQLRDFEYVVYALSMISLAFAVILLLESTKNRVYDLLRLGMSPIILWCYYECLLIVPIAFSGFIVYLIKNNLFLMLLEKFLVMVAANILLGSIIIWVWLHRIYSKGVMERFFGDMFYMAAIAILVLVSALMGNIYSITVFLVYLLMSTRSFNLKILGKFNHTYLAVAGRSFVKFLVAAILLSGLILSTYVAVSSTSMAFADEYSWHKLGCDVYGIGDYDKLKEVMENLSIDGHVLPFVLITELFYYDIREAQTGEKIPLPNARIIAIDPESLKDYISSERLPADLRNVLSKISNVLDDDTMVITSGVNVPDNTEVLIRATMDFMGMPISSEYVKLKVKKMSIGEYPYESPKIMGVIITKDVFEKITNIYSMPEGNIETYENMALYIVLDEPVSKEVLMKMVKDAKLMSYVFRSDIRDRIVSNFEKTFLAVEKSSHLIAFSFAFMLAFAASAQYFATGKSRALQLYRLGISSRQMIQGMMIGTLESFSIAFLALIVVITAITLGNQISITSATFLTVTLNSIANSLKYSFIALLASLIALVFCYTLLLWREYNGFGRI